MRACIGRARVAPNRCRFTSALGARTVRIVRALDVARVAVVEIIIRRIVDVDLACTRARDARNAPGRMRAMTDIRVVGSRAGLARATACDATMEVLFRVSALFRVSTRVRPAGTPRRDARDVGES
jgi:hypothetical protein